MDTRYGGKERNDSVGDRSECCDLSIRAKSVINIRTSRTSDQRRVLEIWREAVDATHHFLAAADRREIEIEVIAFLPKVSLWLAVDQGDLPLGFMLLGAGRMEALFVDPLHRGTGIGRALVEHALAFYATITTDVNEQNLQAVGFYLHLGFEQIGYSERDQQGRPYPLIHLRKSRETIPSKEISL